MKLTLERLCLIMAVIGVVALFLLVNSLEPVSVKIKDIGIDDVGLIISTNGTVVSSELRKNTLFLVLEDEGTIKIVVFEKDLKNIIQPEKGNYINVIGQVENYMGALEIVVKELKILRQ